MTKGAVKGPRKPVARLHPFGDPENALQLDWAEFMPPTLNYIFGNPPFVGKRYQATEQKADLAQVCSGIHGAGLLDYVACWYVKAARFITAETVDRAMPGKKEFKDMRFGRNEQATRDMFFDAAEAEKKSRRAVRCAFVSTNSITQGEQVGVLWSWLLNQGIRIHFAHRTFKWTNEAPGKAAVHCVIIGFGLDFSFWLYKPPAEGRLPADSACIIRTSAYHPDRFSRCQYDCWRQQSCYPQRHSLPLRHPL